jgi:hypothetical protein
VSHRQEKKMFRRLSMLVLLAAGCGSSPSVPGDQVRKGIMDAISSDPRTAGTQALAPADYKAIAEKVASVPGVVQAFYAGDYAGTVYAAVDGGGVMAWNHMPYDVNDDSLLPKDLDYSTLMDPVYNKGWSKPEVVSGPRSAGTYATQFPLATSNPDPEFKSDDTVPCPARGRLAIVDFQQAQAAADTERTWPSTFDVDGLPLWDRVKKMGEAAGFKVRIYLNDEIKAGNFWTELRDYTYVILNGHGGPPGPKQYEHTGKSLLNIITPEPWDDNAKLEDGTRYVDAWKDGLILRGLSGDDKDKVRWTPLLIQKIFKPTVPQAWVVNQCGSFAPAYHGWTDDGWVWQVTGLLYNFGQALRDAGVPAALGYITSVKADAVAHNLLAFLRREFGGYFNKDTPPVTAPQKFWPTCMSVETFFRLKANPFVAVHAPKLEGTSLFTGYFADKAVFLRPECQGSPAIPHNMLADFVLSVGTPATAFANCWDKYWSKGDEPTCIVDSLCCKGEPKLTKDDADHAGCAVMVGRKVTNAMLPTP